MPGKRVRDRSGLPYIHFRVPQYRRTPPVDDMKQVPKKGKKKVIDQSWFRWELNARTGES
jgi:hypothetical protein